MGSQDTSDTSNTKASQEQAPANPAPYEWAAPLPYGFYPSPHVTWGAQPMVPYMYTYGHPCYPSVTSPSSGNDATTQAATKPENKGKTSAKKSRKTKAQSESERSTDASDEEKAQDADKKSQEPGTDVNWEYWNSQNGGSTASGKRGSAALPPLVPSGPVGSGSADLDERELKRQRRKQSNRESARRSRQRKQKECDDLGHNVKVLTEQNESLRAELEKVQAELRELREENLMYKKQNMEAEEQAAMEVAEAEAAAVEVTSSSGGDPAKAPKLEVELQQHQSIAAG